jgi:hypothetical protein
VKHGLTPFYADVYFGSNMSTWIANHYRYPSWFRFCIIFVSYLFFVFCFLFSIGFFSSFASFFLLSDFVFILFFCFSISRWFDTHAVRLGSVFSNAEKFSMGRINQRYLAHHPAHDPERFME